MTTSRVRGEVAKVVRMRDTLRKHPQIQLHMTSLNVYQTAPDAPCSPSMVGWVGKTDFWVELKLNPSNMIIDARRAPE